MTALASASQNATTSRRRSVHQRSVPSWCPRHECARSPSGDRPGSGPGIPESRSGRPSRVRPGPADTAGSRRQRPGARPAGLGAARRDRALPGWPPAPVVALVGRGRHRGQRDPHPPRPPPSASGPACAGLSGWAGGLAATGRLGGAPIHGHLLQAQAEQAVVGGRHPQAQLLSHPGADPLVTAAAQGGGRAAVVGDAAVATAEHQDLNELVEDDPVSDAGPAAAKGWRTWRVGSSADTWTHRGSRTDDGRAGTSPPCDRRCESPLSITARACLVPLRLLAQALTPRGES